jgi:hypothetical protein
MEEAQGRSTTKKSTIVVCLLNCSLEILNGRTLTLHFYSIKEEEIWMMILIFDDFYPYF